MDDKPITVRLMQVVKEIEFYQIEWKVDGVKHLSSVMRWSEANAYMDWLRRVKNAECHIIPLPDSLIYSPFVLAMEKELE